MQRHQIIERIATRLNWTSEESATIALEALLETLGERLLPADLAALAGALPAELVPFLSRGRGAPIATLDEFVARVAMRERVSSESAIEHAQAVCGALRHFLPPRVGFKLALALWPALLTPLFDHHVIVPGHPHGSRRSA